MESIGTDACPAGMLGTMHRCTLWAHSVILLVLQWGLQSGQSQSVECQAETQATSFGAGTSELPPWWGPGLDLASASMAERSLAASLSGGDDAAVGTTGPALWGEGLDVGPASLDDRSAAAAEWHAGVAPERARFSTLGPSGPPTPDGRRLAASLAKGLACRVCQVLVNALWEDLAEPSLPAIKQWLAAGCVPTARRAMLRVGWRLTTDGCGGAGARAADGATWCLLQDASSDVLRHPALAEEYDPAQDAVLLACRRTLGAHAPGVAAFLVSQRNGTPAHARNEHLSWRACAQAACCTSP